MSKTLDSLRKERAEYEQYGSAFNDLSTEGRVISRALTIAIADVDARIAKRKIHCDWVSRGDRIDLKLSESAATAELKRHQEATNAKEK